ncbi:flagellar biosynthesis protein FlhB [Colwellia sp. 4_MG-2023]|uniref:flagellar biosynthesis protein FlhB n=1 Tax=unclassified Colwellia TaxID=196834 RepID=UPI001C09B0CA|nr:MULTISPECIES: flagellar biosynthesis protein FlhB [unclassified Colwellia]MBU2925286.1 flagellar biosynthesis protein FlhB [Colwellia sp. C2M11]MDO6486758.1 flagellar biosynthesis protein FlhB [Colwellia sp. 6_MG-2023]MDO6506944.1 flagellar biosynthesis protein FlhB [Colwellia sp. 5_MG-2023]MDO6556618.1 flagellar biosynthesis protein FlhB [Colwellia sp. 4_MG-2023]MDO6651190.1 flagellar biosynthesis protein FlhB [Colwellia sp. 3_MG-2023]
MAESDSGEKSEEPTAKKLTDARKKGQIARSKDLGTMFVLVGSAFALMVMGSSLVDALSSSMKRLFSLTRNEAMDPHAIVGVIYSATNNIIFPVLAIFFIIMVAAFIGNTMLGGMAFSWEAMAPKASRLSPLAGFKRMFGVQAGVELVKSILKFFVVFIVAFLLLKGLFSQILGLSLEAIPLNFGHAVNMLLWMFLALALSIGLIVVIDAPYQVWNHTRQLKMTKQEIKDEYKSTEGNPEIKGRIKQTQYEMSQRRMMGEVPNSDVVITNPTHYSVALKYDADMGGAPQLVAKGIDEMAIHIRTIAKEHDVEIVQSPALARSLYYTAEVDQDIPEELYAAVAQVLAFIFQLNEHKKGRGKKPIPIAKKLPIPDEFKY